LSVLTKTAKRKVYFACLEANLVVIRLCFCRAAAKSRTGASLFSIIYRDLTASLRHLNPGILLLKPRTKFVLKVCPGYKYKDDAILFPCISFGPGFEYKPIDEFRDLRAANPALQNIFRDLSAAGQPPRSLGTPPAQS
jgi:hypothetical protein